MTPVSALERCIYLISISGYVVLLFKLFRTRLAATYPKFTSYLALQLLFTAVLLPLNPNTNLFVHIWIAAQLITNISYYFVMYELYSLVLNDYPGIQRWGTRTMLIAMVVCLLVAGGSLVVDLGNSNPMYPVLGMVNWIRRGVAFSLVLFIAVMTGFIAYYPIPLKKNTVLHAVLNVIYFLATTMGVFYRNLVGPSVARTLSMLLGALTACVLFSWVFWLRAEGEKRMKRVGVKWTEEQELRLLQQLKSINDSLVDRSKK